MNNDLVFFETSPSADPTDTDQGHWTNPVWLRGVSQGRPAEMQYWHATEHLGSGSTEWLAAYDDNATSIDIKGVYLTDSTGVDSLLLDCPPKPPPAGVDDRGMPVQLRLAVLHTHLGCRTSDCGWSCRGARRSGWQSTMCPDADGRR